MSASSIAKMLSGINFPKDKKGLIDYAEQNEDKVQESDAIIETLKELRKTRFKNMADVEKALGDIR